MRQEDLGSFFKQTDDELLGWIGQNIPLQQDPIHFAEADDRLSLTRLAFQSSHESAADLLTDAYRTVALENLSHGVTEVWFRTSLGDHEDETFAAAAQAAINGGKQAEQESNVPFQVRFVVGMRKHHLDDCETFQTQPCIDKKAVELVTRLASLRRKSSDIGDMILGIDSVGMDSDWRPD